MGEIFTLAALWLGLALIATLLSIWLGIATLRHCRAAKRGVAPQTLMAADVVAPTICDALDLLRLKATLRR